MPLNEDDEASLNEIFVNTRRRLSVKDGSDCPAYDRLVFQVIRAVYMLEGREPCHGPYSEIFGYHSDLREDVKRYASLTLRPENTGDLAFVLRCLGNALYDYIPRSRVLVKVMRERDPIQLEIHFTKLQQELDEYQINQAARGHGNQGRGKNYEEQKAIQALIVKALEWYRVNVLCFNLQKGILKQPQQPTMDELTKVVNQQIVTGSDGLPIRKPYTTKQVTYAMEYALGNTIDEIKLIVTERPNSDHKPTASGARRQAAIAKHPELFNATISLYWVGLTDDQFVKNSSAMKLLVGSFSHYGTMLDLIAGYRESRLRNRLNNRA